MIVAVLVFFQMQRTDADEFACFIDRRRAAPVGMGGRCQDGVVEDIFPVARKLLSRDDLRSQRAFAPACARDSNVSPVCTRSESPKRR